jgi:hypothetical protein
VEKENPPVILFSEKIAEKYFPETGRKKSPINIFSNQKTDSKGENHLKRLNFSKDRKKFSEGTKERIIIPRDRR